MLFETIETKIIGKLQFFGVFFKKNSIKLNHNQLI